MASYKLLSSSRIPFARGHVEQRIYDLLAVDMLVQHHVRGRIGALKAGRSPTYDQIPKKLRLPLTQRRAQET